MSMDRYPPLIYMNPELPSSSNRINWFPELPSSSSRINWFPKKSENKNMFGEIEEIEDQVEKLYKRFRSFKVDAFPPTDHHYLLRRDVRRSRFRQRIKQEWERLYASTPTSTFVRAYEHRIDLMRVAVTGPLGTDFHHCLFFFDIFFPGNYPLDPPEVYYRFDLNPNPRSECRRETSFDRLKQSFFGSNKKEEKDPLFEKQEWDPKKSNILQVLDGIQNMVLNLKLKSLDIYRDESGSLNLSNERTFVLACEMMIVALSNPTRGFEDFVAGHFRRRAHPVLLMFKENKYDGEVVINLWVKLFNAFERNGAYCEHHLDYLKSRNLAIEEVEDLDYLKSRNLTIEEVEWRIRKLECHQQGD